MIFALPFSGSQARVPSPREGFSGWSMPALPREGRISSWVRLTPGRSKLHGLPGMPSADGEDQACAVVFLQLFQTVIRRTLPGALLSLLLMIATSAWPVTLHRPLVSVATAAEALNKSPGEIAALIDAGELLFAWNVASRTATKAEVRILSASLSDYQNGHRARASSDNELPRVVNLIFPTVNQRSGVVSAVTASNLAQRFSVSPDHVFNLIKDGSLQLLRGTSCRRGPGGSPQVLFASVKSFLEERRIL